MLHRINKDEVNESLPLLAFLRDVVNAIFLKYSKDSRLFSSQVRIQSIPSNICSDDTKYYQVHSEHRRIRLGVVT